MTSFLCSPYKFIGRISQLSLQSAPDGGMIGLWRAVSFKLYEWRGSPPTCVSPTNDRVDSQDRGFPNRSCRYTNLHPAQSENYSSHPQHRTLRKSFQQFSKFLYRQTGGRGEASRRVFANFRGEGSDNKTLDLRYQGCFLDGMYVTSIYEGWNFNSGNYLFITDTK